MSSGEAARGAAEGRGACGQRAGGEARTTTGGWGRAAKGQAERQAPCAARKGGGVRKTGRRSRAPEKAAQTATSVRKQRLMPQTATCAHQQLSTSANDVPVLEKAAPTAPRARRQRLMPASGDLRPPTATTHQKKPRRQRPTPASSVPRLPTMFPCLESRADSAPRPQTATPRSTTPPRSRKAAPTAPSVHNRHPAPGKPYKRRPHDRQSRPAPGKPRRQRPTSANDVPVPGKPRRQRPAFTIGTPRRKSRTNSDLRPPTPPRTPKAAPTAPRACRRRICVRANCAKNSIGTNFMVDILWFPLYNYL